MTTHAGEELVSWAEIQDIELVILRRMREFAAGAHPSVFQGLGFDFVGLRDWQPGDRLSAIDWSQSTLTNFSPLITREFEQQSTARLVIVADTSLSTRCGVGGVPIATVIARTVATLALAGAFFQDQVGLITFDSRSRHMAVRPQIGKNHAIHCFDAYQAHAIGRGTSNGGATSEAGLAGLLRQTSLIPVVSDFLFDEPETLLGELAELKARHDVFVVLIDSAYAFELPSPSAGWIEGYDVETGRSRVISAGELRRLGQRVTEWQDTVGRTAHELGLEVLRLGAEADRFHEMLVEFLAERRLRKR